MSFPYRLVIGLCAAASFSSGFQSPSRPFQRQSHTWTTLWATPLPKNISPFEVASSRQNVPQQLVKLASQAIQRAQKDQVALLEIDFPALIDSKTQFDDFDNLQELDANRDWCAQLIPSVSATTKWFVLPDDKETELAANEWTGQRYRENSRFTSIRAAVEHVGAPYSKPWGASIASTVNRLRGGDGVLADSSRLDDLDDPSTPRLQLICQPGNGGPVEDWINVEKLHQPGVTTTVVVNGALDKVRDGYYAPVFFPTLAKTIPFYDRCDHALLLKPISDKGLYGWLFRVYPEDYQVILQTPEQTKQGTITVQDTVVLTSKTRPKYSEAVKALLLAAQQAAQ